jgi:hypothetical protein
MLLLELTMYRDGLAPFISLFSLRLRGELNESRLRESLARLQAKHPLLRCVVKQEEECPRFALVQRPARIPLRIQSRKSDLDWEREARRELLTPFAERSEPLARIVWLRGEGIHELMLVAHHCICDGPSGITLLRDLLSGYDHPDSPVDGYRLLGAMEDLGPPALLEDRGFRSQVRRRSALLRLALLIKAVRRRQSGRGPCANEMYFHRWQLEREEGDRLLERCREEKVTVLAAVAVAFLCAFREVCGNGALRKAYTMVNARRFMPGFQPGALFGMAPGVEISMKKLPRSEAMSMQDFWQSAREIRDELTRKVDRLGKRFYEFLAALETVHDQYSQLVAGTDAAPQVRHITFSNLGRIDIPDEYRSFQIEHMYSPLVMVAPSPANTIVVSSFRGSLEFSIITDEISLPQAQAKALRDRAMTILRSYAVGETHRGSTIGEDRLVSERSNL